jgi:hypothetical protein
MVMEHSYTLPEIHNDRKWFFTFSKKKRPSESELQNIAEKNTQSQYVASEPQRGAMEQRIKCSDALLISARWAVRKLTGYAYTSCPSVDVLVEYMQRHFKKIVIFEIIPQKEHVELTKIINPLLRLYPPRFFIDVDFEPELGSDLESNRSIFISTCKALMKSTNNVVHSLSNGDTVVKWAVLDGSRKKSGIYILLALYCIW